VFRIVKFKASFELRHLNFLESKACFGYFKAGLTILKREQLRKNKVKNFVLFVPSWFYAFIKTIE